MLTKKLYTSCCKNDSNDIVNSNDLNVADIAINMEVQNDLLSENVLPLEKLVGRRITDPLFFL